LLKSGSSLHIDQGGVVMKRSKAKWWVIARERAPKLATQTYMGVAATGAAVVDVGIEAARIVGRVWRTRRMNWPNPAIEN
jgi:hypothetical protein